MTRTLLIAAALATQTGCMTLTPVGPITKSMFPPQAKPADAVEAAAAAPLPPAPPPPAPTLLVTPAEVSRASAPDAARRLLQELDADRKALDAMPSYAEVSHVGR